MQKGSAVWGSNRILYALIFLAMFLWLGHHIDHVIRGNHVGWPRLVERAEWLVSMIGEFLDAPMPEAERAAGVETTKETASADGLSSTEALCPPGKQEKRRWSSA